MKCVLALISFFIISKSFGQVTWGPLTKTPTEIDLPIVLGKADGSYFVLRRYQKENFLESYGDQTLAKVNSIQLNTIFEGRKAEPIAGFIFEGRPTLLFAVVDASLTGIHYLVQSFETSNLSAADLKEITTRPYQGSEPTNYRNLSGLIYYYTNEFAFFTDQKNHEMVLVINKSLHNLDDWRRKNKPRRQYEITRVNTSMEVVSKSSFEIPFDHFTQIQYSFTDNRKFYFMGSEDSIHEYYGNYDKVFPVNYYLFCYDLISGEIQKKELKLENRGIHDCRFDVLNDGKLIVTGFLSAKNESITDCFSMLLAEDMTEISSKIFTLEKEFIRSALSMAEQKKIEGDASRAIALSDFKIKEVVHTNDDGVVLLTEGHTIEYVPNVSIGAGSVDYFENIVAIKFGSDGTKRWEKVIKKHQIYVDQEWDYTSFYAYPTDNGIGLIFNETKGKIMDEFTGKSAAIKPKKVFVSQVLIDQNGNQVEKRLLNFESGKIIGIRPAVSSNSDGTNVLLYARGKSVSVLGKVPLAE
ncbi:MAG: hypothetical protein HYZ14_16165 [Bacteroidetes bacterium]|nr:hypothetical protein [Bacteroidota bacterium]